MHGMHALNYKHFLLFSSLKTPTPLCTRLSAELISNAKKKKMRKKLFEQQRMLLGIQLQPRRKKEFARDELSNAETQFKLETRWTFSATFQSSARKIEMRNKSWTLWKRFIRIMSRMLHSSRIAFIKEIMKIKWKLASFKRLLCRNNSYGYFNPLYKKISYVLVKTDEAVASHHPHFFSSGSYDVAGTYLWV